MSEPATVAAGVMVTIGPIESVAGEASSPGEVAGPSVRFSVFVSNSTAAAIKLDGVVVSVDYGTTREPALELASPGGVPFPSVVSAGATARGTFVFRIPESGRSLVRITVDYAVGTNPTVFEGSAPK